jgi:anti-sigma factor ChrR (cupin superfamily)
MTGKHEIAELLPFYATGTLDAADRARVEAELAACGECAAELRDLEALGASLQARAAAAPPLPEHVLDEALARIAMPPATRAATRLQTAWWGTPARYATAAALVVGFSGAAFAAYHAHEANVGSNTQGYFDTKDTQSTTIFRVTPAPKNDSLATRRARQPAAAAAPATLNATESAPTVPKEHRLAKKARLALLVRDVEGSLKAARTTVAAAGGDVIALADTTPASAADVHEAQLSVEVPAGRLDETLDRLAALGAVQNRAIDAEDVSGAIVDEEARLRNLRREETDLRKLMDKGGKVDEILTVQQNLSEVRGQIEQLDAQHKHDLHRVATSTIEVSLSEDRPNAAPAKPGPSARIDGAWHGGLNALADTVVSFLSALAFCVAYAPVPLALAGAAYFATRFLRARATAT